MSRMNTYMINIGSLCELYTAGSAGRAFRCMVRDIRQVEGQEADPMNRVLIRYKVRRRNGIWSCWFYQEPKALYREP